MKNHQYGYKKVNDEMSQDNVMGDVAYFKGTLDVAAWFSTDSDGNTNLSVVLGNRAKLLSNPDKKRAQ